MSAPQVLLHVGSAGTLNNVGSGDVYIQNDLEVDGVIYGSGAGLSNLGGVASGWTDSGAIVRLATTTDNVGIGTTAPEAKLEVQGAEGTDAGFVLDTDDGDDAADTWSIKSVAADNQLKILNDTNVRMILDSGGNVGIGSTTSPLGRLHIIQGDLLLDNGYNLMWTDNGGTADYIFGLSSADNAQLGVGSAFTSGDRNMQLIVNNATGSHQFFVTGTEKLRLTNAGNLGIGTSAPEQLLEVQAAEATDANILLDADDGDDVADGWFIRSDASDNQLKFLNDTNERIVLTSNGNLGIGTTTPNSRMTVVGVGTTGGIAFQTQNSSGTKVFTLLDNGNVGIGNTTTSEVVNILGSGSNPTIRIKSNAGNYATQFRTPTAGGVYWEMLNGATEVFSVSYNSTNDVNQIDTNDYDFWVYSNADTTGFIYKHATGRLGIGTTAPDTDIDLSGTLSYTPSAAQAITLATNTILANAAVVVLNPNANLTLTSAPTIANGATGQILHITEANGEANTVTVQDQDTLASSNLQLGAVSRTIGAKDVLILMFDGTDWVEINYSNN